MNKFHQIRIIVLVMLGISLSNSSPLARLKRCIPGVWACPGKLQGRNINTLSEPQKTVPEPAKVITSVGAAVKMALEDSPSNGAVTQDEGASTENSVNSYDDDQSEDNPDKCPLRNSSCRRKRMLNRMLKHAKRVERSAKKCPPGIWVC